jgi:Fe(3+) dicitrate transport protein
MELSLSKQFVINDALLYCRGSFGIAHGVYIAGDSPIEGYELEFVPDYTCRGTVRLEKNKWKAQLHGALTGKQFTDATNAEYTPTAVYGEIPAYAILDVGLDRQFGQGDFSLGLKVNNLTDSRYYTRRALAYPGPGILPADGVNIRLAITYAPS